MIATKQALNLTYDAIKKTIRGERTHIDFVGVSTAMGALKDFSEAVSGIFTGEGTHGHGYSSQQLLLGKELEAVRTERGTKDIPELYVNTVQAFKDLRFDGGAKKTGTLENGEPVVGIAFYTVVEGEREEVIIYHNTLENVQDFLKTIGKQLVVEQEFADTIHYKVVDISEEEKEK